MCFYTQQNASIKEVTKRFKATIDDPDSFLVSEMINGFTHLKTPIILDETPEVISTNFSWGLIPSWAKDKDFRKNTLNARIETVDEKPAFKNITNNRCLIIATAYYEWHWNDAKGKEKVKYQINSQEDEIFTFAGLHSSWKDIQTGELLNTYTMLTTEANETMKFVHNIKQRMPVMLKKTDEKAWLDHSNLIKDFAYPYQANLIALPTI
ncbi:SOS response-associated peptidase [Flavobacterium sp. DSR3-2]|uniref:SOS response-associated peptidase n=1 Tax=Flavobacterium sp. DSR3-2 TaxID=2804634 RepID=UPI003CE72AEC